MAKLAVAERFNCGGFGWCKVKVVCVYVPAITDETSHGITVSLYYVLWIAWVAGAISGRVLLFFGDGAARRLRRKVPRA